MAKLKAYRKKYTNKLVTPNREEYVLTLKNIGTISAEDIIDEAADHCRLQKGDIRTAFDAITQAMVLFLKIGHGVQLPNIGSLQPSLRAKAVLKAEDCTQETLKGTGGVNINMQPIGDFKKAVDGFRIRIVKSATDDSSVEDGGDGNDGSNPPSGGGNSNNSGGTGSGNQGGQQQGGSNTGNQNQGGGNQQQTPSEVTYTFKYHDDTEDSRVGLPGEAVDAPDADEGYEFTPEVPSVFGNSSMTFIEQLIAALKYTVTWYTPSGNPIKWYDLAEGETIPDAPQCPDGYHWPSYPSTMPSRDLDIIPEPNA